MPNDDSGKHGVVIPTSVYPFFPEIDIPDPRQNETVFFEVYDVRHNRLHRLAWKYYERYPERRITRLPVVLNNRSAGRRLVVFARMQLADGTHLFSVDTLVEGIDEGFHDVLSLLFPSPAANDEGAYVVLPLDAPPFTIDADLGAFLDEFDRVEAMGFIRSLRVGTTGVGYTFETLLGIEENNDQTADFRGIEIKTKMVRESGSSSSPTNLFQLGPDWRIPGPMLNRLEVIGQPDDQGRLACYSRVTTTPNNKRLWLDPGVGPYRDVALLLEEAIIGGWSSDRLAERLAEKHSRAVFVKAAGRRQAGEDLFHYQQVVYCERPDIGRFLDLVEARRIVFEFAMRENGRGGVRNHGYPWRLIDQRELDQLFALQMQLR
ncbi:MvaI/BcnI family restriction endonuclease [Nocardioides cavernaquae]|uniref:MvaI/BcnI family restriction endonuclease n=1 Tax=Nocardioides cavernaquae TaxID=2321396 RepID=UPI0011C3AF30|nr:MvaI/BcnI family restriction endonuclease [Nocardioides cavernaquae]